MGKRLSVEQLEQFVGYLEDPEASEELKSIARLIVNTYLSKSPEEAYQELLRIRAADDVNAFSEYVFGHVPAVHHREMTRILNDESKKRVVIVAPPASAKCLGVDTKVLLAGGGEKRIADLEVGEVVRGIDSTDPAKPLSSGKVLWKEMTGVKKVSRVKTAGGKELLLTDDHRMLTREGWKRGDQLKPGYSLLAREEGDQQVWDVIVQVEDAGGVETCDIEVEGIHNFFANGLVSHNSTYVSLIYPTYLAGKNPNSATIMLGESFSQMEKFNSQIRPILKGVNEVGKKFHAVFPETKADEDAGWTREKLYLANRTLPIKDPNLFFAGAGSSAIQGARADLILLDDIVGPEKIRSATEMEKIRESLNDLVIPRLHSDGRVVCVMTRWAVNDLAELFLKKLGFEMVYMPALCEDSPNGSFIDIIPSKSYLRYPQEGDKVEKPQWVDHPNPDEYVKEQLEKELKLAHSQGMRAEITTSKANYELPCVRKYIHADNDPVLWPELNTVEALHSKRKPNPVRFRLVYNGDPTGVTGDVYKREWFRYYGVGEVYEHLPKNLRWYMSVDPSVGQSKKGEGDWFVALVVAVDEQGNKFVVDMFRDKLLPPQQRTAIEEFYAMYPQVSVILIDSQNYQASLFHELAQMGLPSYPFKTIKNKMLRLEGGSIYFAQGKVYLRKDAPWLSIFEDEHTDFPRGKHDDIIDAGSMLHEFLSTYRPTEELEVSFEAIDDDWED